MIPQDGRPSVDELYEIMGRAGEKWPGRTALALAAGPVRFNELRRRMEGITQRVLTRTLRSMERDGLVMRSVVPGSVSHVEYELTDLGRAARDLMGIIETWIHAHYSQISAARQAFDARERP